MIGDLVEFGDLQRLTGYDRLADVERCLTKAGIRFFRGKGGIWTTMALVNQAGGLKPAGSTADPYSPDLAA